ncbi:MAG: glycosyltransferase [Polyangiales bacterium]
MNAEAPSLEAKALYMHSGELQKVPTALHLSVIVPVYNERHLVGESLRRLLALGDPAIASLQVIVVDDCSSDGSVDIVEAMARADSRIELLRHTRNQGKGAALRTGLAQARGDVTLVHDADLEYDPRDIPALLRPFLEEGADAVFGSRYLSAPYRRTLMFRHSVMNRMLTRLSNLVTDLDLTDMETCYKAVCTELLRSIPLRSNDFRFELEITCKLAKRRARIFEVPIRYLPRSYEEGKKIGPIDGLRTLGALAYYSVVDDMYQQDEYGSHILAELDRAHNFNQWMGQTLRPFLGDRVLELGSGIGTLTNQFIPRERYLASDINPAYLQYLRSYAVGKPYLEVRRIDASTPTDFEGLDAQFDTVVMCNVLEHLDDAAQTIANIKRVLMPGGRAILLVPQGKWLFGTLDEALQYRRRYVRKELRALLEEQGFTMEVLDDHNRMSVPVWWMASKVLGRRRFSRVQLKALNSIQPLIRHIDIFFPWQGQSLIAVAKKGPAG